MAEASSRVLPKIEDSPAYLEARLHESATLIEVLEQLRELAVFCTERRPSRLLVDFRAVTLNLSTVDRFEIGSLGARFHGLVGKVACLARAEMIDPRKFGVTVAQNRGLRVDIFDSADQAVRWLLAD